MLLMYKAINLLLVVMEYAVIARVIISWLPVPRNNAFIGILYQVTEPILAPIRRMIERSSWGRNMFIDISPLIAFFLIGLIRSIVRSIFLF